MLLSIESNNIAFGMPYLSRNAQKLHSSAFTGDERADLAMIVEQTLQGLNIAVAVGLVGTSHQQGKVPLLGIIASKVRMDAPRDLAKESLEAWRRVELFGLARLAECGIMGLLRLLPCLLGSATGGVRVIEVNLALCNARFKVIKLSVKDANLAKITPFKGLELGPELSKLRFALRKPGTNAGKLLALLEKVNVVRGWLKDDLRWHAASCKRGNF
jgi:hypothetical protein